MNKLLITYNFKSLHQTVAHYLLNPNFNITKNVFGLLALLVLSLTTVAQPVIPERPNPPKLVNDLAGILSVGQVRSLENRLVAYNDSTSTQITVVTVKSLGGEEASFFAFELGEKWGVGQADEDNGIVILIAPNERKAFIATGYGTEGAIPDAYAKRIVEDLMIPQFKNKNYFAGISAAVDRLAAYLRGEFKTTSDIPVNPMVGFFIMLALFLCIFFLFAYLSSKAKGGGITYSGKGVKPFNRGNGPAWGGSTWSTGGGGFGKSGGGFGGGSSSGGGFGGFGGGSFGGGGAGGSW